MPELQAPAAGASWRFWRIVAAVLLAEGVAITAFYGLEWNWLRTWHVAFLQSALPALGCSAEAAGHLLTVQGHAFKIDADCTYIDLILCSLPLLWRVQRRYPANLAVMAAFAAAVVVVNLARVLYGVYALAHGANMFWAHDLVDYVLWYPTLAVVALLWMRSLKTLWTEPNEPRSSRREEAHSEIRNSQSLLTSAATFSREETGA